MIPALLKAAMRKHGIVISLTLGGAHKPDHTECQVENVNTLEESTFTVPDNITAEQFAVALDGAIREME